MGRPTKEQAAAKLTAQKEGQPATTGLAHLEGKTVDVKEFGEISKEAEKSLTQDQRFEALESHCHKLEEAISRIAVLTGNGNHLRELGIERWVPGKKHMNKKCA